MIDQEPSGDNPLSADTEKFLKRMSRQLEAPLHQRLLDQYLPRQYRIPVAIFLILIVGGGVISVASGDWQFQAPEAPPISTSQTPNPARLIATYTSLESYQSPTPIYLELIQRSQPR